MRRLAVAGVRGLRAAATAAAAPPRAGGYASGQQGWLASAAPAALVTSQSVAVRALTSSAGAPPAAAPADAAERDAAASGEAAAAPELQLQAADVEEEEREAPSAARQGARRAFVSRKRATAGGDAGGPTARKLSALVHARKHEEARQLFEQWRAGTLTDPRGDVVKFVPSLAGYNLFLVAAVALSGENGLPLLRNTLAEMERHGVAATAGTFNPHMFLAYVQKNWPLAQAVLDELRSRKLEPTATACCFALAVATTSYRLREAGEVLAQMGARGVLKPDNPLSPRVRTLLNQLFFSAVRGRLVDVAEQAVRALVRQGTQPSAALYGELLVAAAEADDCDMALRALTCSAEARPEGLPARLDEGTLLAAMGAAARGRHAALADAAWAALEAAAAARGAPPSAAAYAALLACRAGRGDVEGAFRALRLLQGAHGGGDLPPGALAPLVAACAGGADALDAAYYAAERLHVAGEGAGVAALNVVVAACARAGDVQRAFETFEAIEGVAFGLAPTTASYNALLAACVWHGRAWAAERLEAEMRAKGVPPDPTTTGLLIDAALAQRDLDGAMARLEQADGAAPARDSLRRLLAYTRRGGDEAARAKVLAAMRRARGGDE